MMSDSEQEEEAAAEQIKVVFVGAANVGKTSVIRRFCYDDFARPYAPTVGADFYVKRLAMPGRRRELVLKLTDIAGIELDGHMLDKYLFKADIIILVYDITSTESFDSMCAWIDAVSNLITSPPFSAIIGNKCDLEHQRAVRLDRTRQFVKEFGFYSFLTSAKTGEWINSSIIELVAKYVGVPFAQLQREQQQPSSTVVKAELSSARGEGAGMIPRKVHVHQSKSSVCALQ